MDKKKSKKIKEKYVAIETLVFANKFTKVKEVMSKMETRYTMEISSRYFVNQIRDATKSNKDHECKLFTQPIPILHLVVDSGIFIKLRRRISGWCMIYDEHPFTSKIYKSSNSRMYEAIRLLNYRVYIIHPCSKLSLYWEFAFAAAFLIYMFNLMTISLYRPDILDTIIGKYVAINELLDLFFIIDIIKKFISGYYDKEQGKAIVNPKGIIIHYLKYGFLLDLLPCLNCINLLLLKLGFSINNIVIAILRLLTYLRILQCIRLKRCLELFSIYSHMTTWLSRFLKFIILLIVLLLTTLSLSFFVKGNYDRYIAKEKTRWGDLRGAEPLFVLWNLLLQVSSLADTFGYNGWPVIDKYFFILVMVVGYCLNLFVFVQIYRMWIHFWNRDRFDDLHEQINQYLRYKRLPTNLRSKIFAYYEYQFKNRFFDENRINRMLPKLLKQEILLNITQNHIQQVEFFHEIPDIIMSQLVLRLKSEIFLTNDIIIKAGAPGDCMFFIYFGTVGVFLPNEKEICHLDDGEHFGEIALIFKEKRVATVKALTSCELFKLTREDFLAVLEPHPEIKDKIYTLALERLKSVGSSYY